MKKYMLGLCLLLSGSVFAYEGATLEFMSNFFRVSVSDGITRSLSDVAKRDCARYVVLPAVDKVSQDYLDDEFTAEELRYLDEFFDTPLGENMLTSILSGDIEVFFEVLEGEYDETQYRQYLSLINRLFKGDISKHLTSDAMIQTMTHSVDVCQI